MSGIFSGQVEIKCDGKNDKGNPCSAGLSYIIGCPLGQACELERPATLAIKCGWLIKQDGFCLCSVCKDKYPNSNSRKDIWGKEVLK